MAGLAYASKFQDLLVYQKARALARDLFQLTSTFPRDEAFSLTSQVRRSSRSVGAQIAEAWAKRRHEKHFMSKLTDADGEQMETQHWLESAVDCGYASREQIEPLLQQCTEIGRLLGGMPAKAELFCKPGVPSFREEQALYFVSTTDTED